MFSIFPPGHGSSMGRVRAMVWKDIDEFIQAQHSREDWMGNDGVSRIHKPTLHYVYFAKEARD
ncbi:MAG: hypothetical protein M1834_003325 [Cirrosporium novae-zelandiae]|nr:MAG: hypothetical protein M1834_003325 [Cirrosporium novae-zelandiae]